MVSPRPPISRTSGPAPTCSDQMSRPLDRMCCPISDLLSGCLGPRSVAGRELLAPRRRPRVGERGEATVVEGRDAIAVGQPVELVLPHLDAVPGARDQQDVGPLAHLLGPDVQIAGSNVG